MDYFRLGRGLSSVPEVFCNMVVKYMEACLWEYWADDPIPEVEGSSCTNIWWVWYNMHRELIIGYCSEEYMGPSSYANIRPDGRFEFYNIVRKFRWVVDPQKNISDLYICHGDNTWIKFRQFPLEYEQRLYQLLHDQCGFNRQLTAPRKLLDPPKTYIMYNAPDPSLAQCEYCDGKYA